jgi:hypothetical protein
MPLGEQTMLFGCGIENLGGIETIQQLRTSQVGVDASTCQSQDQQLCVALQQLLLQVLVDPLRMYRIHEFVLYLNQHQPVS